MANISRSRPAGRQRRLQVVQHPARATAAASPAASNSGVRVTSWPVASAIRAKHFVLVQQIAAVERVDVRGAPPAGLVELDLRQESAPAR